MSSHPELHTLFITYHFRNDQAGFLAYLLTELEVHKQSRNCYAHDIFEDFPELEIDPNLFFSEVPFMTNTDLVEEVVQKLFNLSIDDSLYVEKSYHLLEEIISYAKKEGGQELIEQLKQVHLRLKKLPDSPTDFITRTQTAFDRAYRKLSLHESQDFSEGYLLLHLERIQEYCRTYRQDAFKLHQQLLAESKHLV